MLLACEVMGPWSIVSVEFLGNISEKITLVTGDANEKSHLYQIISNAHQLIIVNFFSKYSLDVRQCSICEQTEGGGGGVRKYLSVQTQQCPCFLFFLLFDFSFYHFTRPVGLHSLYISISMSTNA